MSSFNTIFNFSKRTPNTNFNRIANNRSRRVAERNEHTPVSMDYQKGTLQNRELQVCFQRYTAKPVPTGTPGRPKVSINFEQIEELLSYPFNINMISKIIGVHRTTLWRRMKENGYDYSKKYTDINPESIDSLVTEIKLLHPYSGERTVTGIIRSRGLKIQRWKLRESIHRIDPINTALRWLRKNPRFVYSVPGPNSL